jgi:hypothetical protein
MGFPEIKKEISLFLSSEEAKMLKKDVAKVGLSAAVIAAIMAQAADARAQAHDDSAHGDHNDGHDDAHTDSHSDGHADSHSDVHNDGHGSHSDATGTHNSVPRYDNIRKRGGHLSSAVHSNY